MHRLCRLLVGCAIICTICQAAAWGDDSLTGSGLLMKTSGSATLSNTGFVGTYVTVPNVVDGGAYIDLSVNGSYGVTGAGDPHMNLVIADTKYSFNLSGLNQTHTLQNVFLPAGTYVVRAERDYVDPASASARSATINSLSAAGNGGAIPGLTFSNSGTPTQLNALALAAADTYIANFRKGAPTISLVGVAPGTPVSVDLVRHAFNHGNAVPGTSTSTVNNYLGTGGTAQQTNYQSRLNQNFNAITPENIGKWSSHESTRDTSFVGLDDRFVALDQFLNYAPSHNMRARMHNLIWGNQQPTWSTTMRNSPTATDTYNAATNPQGTNLQNIDALYSDLLAPGGTPNAGEPSEIHERIAYYVGDGDGDVNDGDRSQKYFAVDVYNESYHTGSAGAASTYWNRYTATGIAKIYRDVRDAVTAAGSTARTFVNEYNVLADMGGDGYSNWYSDHTRTLRDAGYTAGYGDVVGGIGLQYYVNPFDGGLPDDLSQGEHYPQRIMQALQNLSVHGVPLTLTEFGVKTGSSEADAANMVEDTVRLMFGNASADGFFMWGFVAENGGGNLFAPAAAFYNVNTSNWNAMTITDAGERWRDLWGIEDFDGDPNNGWDTLLTGGNAPLVDANGNITFNGFYGDYVLTIDGEQFPLTLVKGTSNYQIVVNPLANDGDYDDDGDKDAADIDILWQIVRGTGADPNNNDTADLDGSGLVNEDDVDNMLASKLTAGASRAYGDANLSGGTPELTDYNLWRTGTGGWANGDFDGSGGVPELNDYNLWRTGPTQFPGTVGSHGGGGAPLVPEPATIVLMGLALPALLAATRRRKPRA